MTVAWTEEDEHVEDSKSVVSSSPASWSTGDETRPFKRALQALHRATASIGQPHRGVSFALNMTLPAISGTEKDRSKTRKGEKQRPDTGAASERCRVGLDMVRLLAGPDGRDATGRVVGVVPGQDVEAAVLGGCSQVRRVVAGTVIA